MAKRSQTWIGHVLVGFLKEKHFTLKMKCNVYFRTVITDADICTPKQQWEEMSV